MVGRDQYGSIKGPYCVVKPGPMPPWEHDKVESKKHHTLGGFPKLRRRRPMKSLLTKGHHPTSNRLEACVYLRAL